MIHLSHYRRALLAAALLVPGALLAQPRRVVLQGVIDQPGNYVLPNDLNVSATRGAGIMITASGVDLDLSGSNIIGPGGLQGTGIHIRGAHGVTVHGGKLSGLAFGVIVENSSNVAVRNLNIRGEGLAPAAPPPEVAVMILQSRNVVVENNLISGTGLGIFVRGGRSVGNRIVNNTVTAIPGAFAALGICYNPAPGDPMGPRGDLIQGNHIVGYPTAIQMNSTSAYNIIRQNTLVFAMEGVTGPAANTEMDNVKVKTQ